MHTCIFHSVKITWKTWDRLLMPPVELAWVAFSRCCAGFGWEEGSGWDGLRPFFYLMEWEQREHTIVTAMYHCHFHNVKVLYYHLLWSASQQPHKVNEVLEYKNLGIFFCLEKEAGMGSSQALYLLDVSNTQYMFLSLSWLRMKKRGKQKIVREISGYFSALSSTV